MGGLAGPVNRQGENHGHPDPVGMRGIRLLHQPSDRSRDQRPLMAENAKPK